MAPIPQPDPLTVAIIVEREASGRILELADQVHVWAVDTEANRQAAQQVWDRRKGTESELSMTVFQFHDGPPDVIVVSELDAIDLHHDDRSQVPPWSRALVFGAPATANLVSEFRRIGFNAVTEMASGFIAVRSDGAG